MGLGPPAEGERRVSIGEFKVECKYLTAQTLPEALAFFLF